MSRRWWLGFWLVYVSVMLLILLLGMTARAHTPPQYPSPAEFCAVFEPMPDCEQWFTDWIAESYEDALRSAEQGDPVYRGRSTGDVTEWRALVAVYWPPELTEQAMCLIHYESGGNPDAKNPTSSARGLFQIMASVWADNFGVTHDQLYDPTTNIRLAYRIYQIQGWGAWSPYNRGLCHD